jgi:hypothetical protein
MVVAYTRAQLIAEFGPIRQSEPRLLGQEVFPAVNEKAKEIGLKTLFETGQPVSTRYMAGWCRRSGPRRNEEAAHTEP